MIKAAASTFAVALVLLAAAPLPAWQQLKLEWRPARVVVGLAAGKPATMAVPGLKPPRNLNQPNSRLSDAAIADVIAGRGGQNASLDPAGFIVSRGGKAGAVPPPQAGAELAGCIPLDAEDLGRDAALKLQYYLTPINCRPPKHSRAYVVTAVRLDGSRISSFVVNLEG